MQLGMLDRIESLKKRRRNLVLMTGDIDGLFLSQRKQGYMSLEEVLLSELEVNYHVLSFDINKVNILSDGLSPDDFDFKSKKTKSPSSVSIDFLLGRKTNKEIAEDFGEKEHSFLGQLVEADYQPIKAIELLRLVASEFSQKKANKPLLLIVRNAGLLFPKKTAGDLSLDQAHRLQAFINWMQDGFGQTEHLIIMLSPTMSEVSDSLLQLPNLGHLELGLPSQEERLSFIKYYQTQKSIQLPAEMNEEQLVHFTNGLPLLVLQDIFEEASCSDLKITPGALTEMVNQELKRRLGDIVTFERPMHGTDDVVGYDRVKSVFADVFTDCSDPSTAHSMILVTGPNGTGKSFMTKAFAKESGRVVVVLSKIRDSLFGGTEKLFEQFRMVAETFDNLLVLMDEADAVMGNVNNQDTHEVERRFTAGILDMASDKRYLGKLLWVLMTARPERLSSDVLSRCSGAIIPIFDLAGDERMVFVEKLFIKRGVEYDSKRLGEIIDATQHFSNRDYDDLVKKMLARKKRNMEVDILKMLQEWSPGRAIQDRREYQELIAAEHATFPLLIPDRITKLSEEERRDKITAYQMIL